MLRNYYRNNFGWSVALKLTGDGRGIEAGAGKEENAEEEEEEDDDEEEDIYCQECRLQPATSAAAKVEGAVFSKPWRPETLRF